MDKRTVTVFLPTGSKAEAAAARRILGLDYTVLASWAPAHTVGQTIYGDAIAIGTDGKGLENDVRGTFQRFPDLAAMERAYRKAPSRDDNMSSSSPARDGAIEAEPEVPAPAPPSPTAEWEGLDRSELVAYAARRWPRARQSDWTKQYSWATMGAHAIKAAIVEIEGRGLTKAAADDPARGDHAPG